MSAPRRKLTAQERDARDLAIARMLDAGRTWRDIEAATGAAPSQISAISKAMKEAGQ